jgi:uncharacterized protein YndB with AHSA1/START domain
MQKSGCDTPRQSTEPRRLLLAIPSKRHGESPPTDHFPSELHLVRISLSLAIEAPLESVFEFIDDDQKNLLWMNGLEETVCVAPGAADSDVGKQFIQRIRLGAMGVEYHGEVTRHDPPERVALRVHDKGGNYRMEMDYRLSLDAGGATCLDYTCEMSPLTTMGSAMVAGMRPVAKRMLMAQFTRLKDVAESLVGNAQLS